MDRRELASLVDLLVVLGGDGTILRTVRFVSEYNIPIVGINLGEFGYLTEVNLNEMFSALELIVKGELPDGKEDDARYHHMPGNGNGQTSEYFK